ncbi:MAG: hypothetical protein WCQ21_23800 [Verrucomicrobiota bacterium]
MIFDIGAGLRQPWRMNWRYVSNSELLLVALAGGRPVALASTNSTVSNGNSGT